VNWWPATRLWPGAVWAADNSAFTSFDADAFLKMLATLHGVEGGRFVAVPDVVADAPATLARFRLWAPVVRAHDLPVALVAQDGLVDDQVPWRELQALFIGGSTEWKLGAEARSLAGYAKAHGKWVHMGRVNTRARMHYAEKIGCDSVDGTCFSRWSDIKVPKGLQWTAPLPLFS